MIRDIKNSTYDINDDEILNMYTQLMCKLKINKKINLKYCDSIRSPFGTGFLKPCIVIPSNCYNYKEIKLILNHELIHFKKHDLLYKIIVLVVKTMHWFNPLIYVMSKFIDSDCEMACDESLLKNSSIEERKLYAITVIDSLRFNKKHAFENNIITGFNNNKNILKRRFENMLNLKPKKTGMIIGVLSALIISSSLVSINVFAESSKTYEKPIINKTSNVLYKGKAKDIPAKMINSNNMANLIKEHPNEIVHVIEKSN
jgi:beta-lactamase regulating signal transducer with metallopeptidase domain